MPIGTQRRGWDAATVFVVFAVAVAHALFLKADLRIPRDLGQYYQSLPILFRSLDHPGPDLLWLLFERGGWYNALVALWLRAFGRTGDVFQSLDIVGVAAIVALAALAARAVVASHPSRAGFVAACFAAAAPIVTIQGRTSWIHIPETALVLGALVAHLRDPRLERTSTIVASGICGMLAISLRPSGLVWMASLLPLLWIVPEASRRRAGATVGLWALGILPLLSDMRLYLDAKMSARGRYAEQVPELFVQLQSGLGAPVILLGLIGLVVAVRRQRGPVENVLVAWLFLPLVLWGVFRAGIDNFTPVAPALGILAAIGFAPRLLPVLLSGLLWFGYYIPQYLWPGESGPTVQLSKALGLPASPHRGSFYRPFGDPAYEVVPALIDATCPPPEPCVIAVDQGLFEPYGEDPGFLRLFLSDRDYVRLLPIAMPTREADPQVAALVRYTCSAEHEKRWRERFPESEARAASLVGAGRLEEAWKGDAYPGCLVSWLTPDGELAREEFAPDPIPTAGGGAPGMGAPMRPDAPPSDGGLAPQARPGPGGGRGGGPPRPNPGGL